MDKEQAQETLVLVSRGEEQTEEIGLRFAACLKEGDVVCLTGDLGAGKTCFVRGVVRGLTGDPGLVVPSPSFVLMRTYPGRVPVHHFDFYRLPENTALEELGFEEFLFGDTISLIEWCDRLKGVLPVPRIDVHLFIVEETCREIRIGCFAEERITALESRLGPDFRIRR